MTRSTIIAPLQIIQDLCSKFNDYGSSEISSDLVVSSTCRAAAAAAAGVALALLAEGNQNLAARIAPAHGSARIEGETPNTLGDLRIKPIDGLQGHAEVRNERLYKQLMRSDDRHIVGESVPVGMFVARGCSSRPRRQLPANYDEYH